VPATDDGGPDPTTASTAGQATSTGEPPQVTGDETAAPLCGAADDCDDGEFCNGAETCDTASVAADEQGCVPGEPPCGSRVCDDVADRCVVDCDADEDGDQAVACGGSDCDDDDDEINLNTTDYACVDARRVFTTSQVYNGNLGGAVGADAICQQAAGVAQLGGTWLAFIVDDANDLQRHSQATVPYMRLDGTWLADDWTDLTDGSLAATADRDQQGQSVGGNAWTGFKQVGGGGAANCDNWSTAQRGCLQGGPCGAAGETGMTDGHWQGWFVFHCSDNYRLYCIEQ
jgi:hypothetical protein